MRELVLDLERDMGGELPTTAQRALMQRFASLTVAAEAIEQRIADGDTADADTLIRLTRQATRVLRELGLAADAPGEPERRRRGSRRRDDDDDLASYLTSAGLRMQEAGDPPSELSASEVQLIDAGLADLSAIDEADRINRRRPADEPVLRRRGRDGRHEATP